MKLVIHLHNDAEENLLDIGCPFTAVKDDEDGHLVATFTFDEDEDALIESTTTDELIEFFGIDSENLIYTEIH